MTSFLHSAFTKVLVTTGSPSNDSVRTEVFDLTNPNAICEGSTTLDFFRPLMFATGGLLNGNRLILCGGAPSETHPRVLRNCWTLGTRRQFTSMLSTRAVASSIVVNGGQGLWITGGFHPGLGGPLRSTEIVSIDGTVRRGPNLPARREGHCLVKLNSTTAMLIGGSNHSYTATHYSRKTWFHDIQTRRWIRGPNLNLGRTLHSCGTITDIENGHRMVVVAGGKFYKSFKAWSTEIMDLSIGPNGNWTSGP